MALNLIYCFFFEAPVAKTLTDFWQLVWQEHPPTIVMVTNLKEGEKVVTHVTSVYIMKFTHVHRLNVFSTGQMQLVKLIPMVH